MKYPIATLFVLIILFVGSNTQSQEIPGIWSGKLAVGGGLSLTIVFKIDQDATGTLTGIMDSPDQGAFGIVLDKITYKDNILFINSDAVRGQYNATYSDSGWFNGTWEQGGYQLPLSMKKYDKVPEIKRPQTPEPPFPYQVEEVTFDNKDAGITLAGTITRPEGEGPFPAVVMITGSGAQDRDEMIFQHRPFWVIADYLTRQGYVVLRFDDRGVGESGGDFSTATSADFATDAGAALDFLKSQNYTDKSKLGLIGHSEGGMIAPMLASNRDDIAFLVLLAGPAQPSSELMALQTKMVLESLNMNDKLVSAAVGVNKEIYNVLINEPDDKKATKKIKKLYKVHYKELTDNEKSSLGYNKNRLDQSIQTLLSPWFRYFIAFDPMDYLPRVDCKILALNGTNDIQVPYKENLDVLKKLNGEKGNITTMAFPGLNHLFQKCTTCDVAEYARLEETFNEDVLKFILSWLDGNVKEGEK